MKWKLLLFLSIIFLIQSQIYAQQNKELKLNFNALFNGFPLTIDSNYLLPNNDTISIETCRFYISNIQLFNNNKLVFSDTNSAHLIDVSEPNSMHINLNIPYHISYQTLKFNIGIDSTLNVLEVMSGDLDPTKGMYWAWQSGYINFKLEGKSIKSPSRYKQFQFHLGGYLGKNNALQTAEFQINQKSEINIDFKIDAFLNNINLSNMYQIMSPSPESVILSKKIAQLFILK